MKANAPEKIYLQENTTTDCYDELWPEWFEAKATNDDIEYTRTDACIEKAVNWFRAHWRDYVGIDKYNVIHFGLWENDFKNYMKGE